MQKTVVVLVVAKIFFSDARNNLLTNPFARKVCIQAISSNCARKMTYRYDLDDNWDDVRYVEHDGTDTWSEQQKSGSSKSEFTKRLKAEAKVSVSP